LASEKGPALPQRPQFDPAAADSQGFVAIGGDLRPATLLRAYRRGVFPWYDESLPICWWSPDPRAILPLDQLHVSRRLARTLRTGRFRVTFDLDFAGVIRGCAEERGEGTWLVPAMIDAYERLHELGHAHSVEVWSGDTLAGGLYGLAIGQFFSAESMFHRITDASKVAVVGLVEKLRAGGFDLVDIQFLTPHTARLGAIELPRSEYLRKLAGAIRAPARFA
jgi:leucyl/phenylalanyl-tRNA---protein transferase